MIHYYIWKQKDGKVVGWLQSISTNVGPTAIEVTKEEFVECGGHIDNYSGDTENIAKEAYVDAKISAIASRQDFLEDCIAEMAMKVYE